MRHILLSCTLLALGTTACATKSASTVTTEGSASTRPVARTEPPPAPPASEQSEAEPLDFGPIFYALDSSRLTPESQQLLERVAMTMRRTPGTRVTIAGHTCELGTTEYNIALGQQRAAVARDFLVRMGVEDSRVRVMSYGEESPRAHGGTEDVHQQNRRSEFSFVLESTAKGNG
jgi:peptidoglycan-associated lipoprotein